MKLKLLFLITILAVLAASCGTASTPTSAPTEEPTAIPVLTIMTHDSFSASAEVIESFKAEYGVEVRFLEAGDAGTTVNKAILSQNSPMADVLYGVDNTFLSRALEEGIFEPYASPLLEDIPAEFKLDDQNMALPVDFGDVCLNYEKAYFEENSLEPPSNLEDLLKPEYKGLVVVENPATSSPGLAFLFATIGHFGEDGYLDYWRQLIENEAKVVNDWETAYYAEFSRWGGEYPIVVSYGSSPPFEVIFAEEPMDEPPTAAVTGPGSCFRQIEFVGILKGTQNRDLAEKWIDFMLSPTFQEDIPLNMYVFPVNQNAELNETFAKYLVIPVEPATLAPSLIAENREEWIQAWTDLVLR